jgi:hypothetical protein
MMLPAGGPSYRSFAPNRDDRRPGLASPDVLTLQHHERHTDPGHDAPANAARPVSSGTKSCRRSVWLLALAGGSIQEVPDAVGAERAEVVANGVGGPMAMFLAAAYPNRFDSGTSRRGLLQWPATAGRRPEILLAITVLRKRPDRPTPRKLGVGRARATTSARFAILYGRG